MDYPKKRGRPRKEILQEVVEPKRNAMGRIIEEPNVEPSAPTEPYKLTITLGDKTYESTGTTMLEALEKVATPPKIFVKGFVKVEHGDKRTERLFMPSQMKRFLFPVARVLVAKALSTTLK